MRPFVLTCMLTALAGCGTLPCKDGTVLAELTLEGAAAAADQFTVHATLDGEQWNAGLAHRPGTTEGTLELDFAHGYPAGSILSFTIDAQSRHDDPSAHWFRSHRVWRLSARGSPFLWAPPTWTTDQHRQAKPNAVHLRRAVVGRFLS